MIHIKAKTFISRSKHIQTRIAKLNMSHSSEKQMIEQMIEQMRLINILHKTIFNPRLNNI